MIITKIRPTVVVYSVRDSEPDAVIITKIRPTVVVYSVRVFSILVYSVRPRSLRSKPKNWFGSVFSSFWFYTFSENNHFVGFCWISVF